MTCPHCQASNPADEERCHRCGRRFRPSGFGPRLVITGREATARVLEAEPLAQAAPADTAPQRTAAGRTLQPSLFPVKVLPLVPLEPEAPPKRKGRRRLVRLHPRPDEAGQQSFDFDAPALHPPSGPEPLAPEGITLAPRGLRLRAALVDWSIIAGGALLFGALFHAGLGWLAAEAVPRNAKLGTLLVRITHVAIPVLVAAGYHCFWCAANVDSFGMRLYGLRLVRGDSQPPDVGLRFRRLAAFAVGLLGAGVGLAWALYDKEHACGHDLISGSFPVAR